MPPQIRYPMLVEDSEYIGVIESLQDFLSNIAFDLKDGHTHCDDTITLIISDIDEMLLVVEEELNKIGQRNRR